MADLSRLKRRNTLGAPPSPEEASRNLAAPEVAPADAPAHHAVPPAPPVAANVPSRAGQGARIDGRGLRKTGRTVQFATRVSMDFDDRLRRTAQREGLMLCEVLERALDKYLGDS